MIEDLEQPGLGRGASKRRAPTEALILKLEARDTITFEERSVIESLVQNDHSIKRRDDIVGEGDRPSVSTLLVEGFAGRYRLLPTGARQITAIHVPGDFVDIHSHLLKTMDHGVVALTDVRIVQVPHPKLTWVSENHPHLWRMFNLCALIDGAIHREWVAALGRRSSLQRMAHLFCEMSCLLKVVELVSDDGFAFPITQMDLADVMGLSSVHVNRTLQELRTRRLVEFDGKRVRIRDFDQLAALAMYDDTYLHLVEEPR